MNYFSIQNVYCCNKIYQLFSIVIDTIAFMKMIFVFTRLCEHYYKYGDNELVLKYMNYRI